MCVSVCTGVGVCVCSDNRCTLVCECGKINHPCAQSSLSVCVCVCLCGWMRVFTSQTVHFKLLCLPKKSTKQRALFVCLSLLGGMYFTRHTSFSPGFTLDTSWRELRRHNVSRQCHKWRGKCVSSYRKVVWQPPVLIKNALTLNTPINLSMLYLARVALCTDYKTQQLKQVLLASSRPSRAY